MNAHKLAVLGGVAVVALAAALWSTGTRTPVQDDTPSEMLVPGLETKLNDITAVRVRVPGDTVAVTLVRDGDRWGVQERGGYEADVPKLRAWLLKLAQARRVEEKTSTPALYDRLGVEPLDTPEAYGAQVELDGIEPPVRLILGRNVPRGSGTYARFADQPQSWEANADLAVERLPAGWLLRDLADIAATRVDHVDVQPAQGPAVHVGHAPTSGGAEFTVTTVPKGRELQSEFVADATAGLFASLHFDDVLATDAVPPPARGLTKTTLVTKDGLSVDVVSWIADEKTHARFTAALDESKATPETLETLRAELATLSRRFDNRTFVLPPYKADVINKPLEGYLKPKA